MDVERYLARVGVDPERAREADLETLALLQRAHVTAVPWETLSITGHPFGDGFGEGVTRSVVDAFEKIVDRGRGGFCYELNELFGWLLAELGFGVDRLAARVVMDGTARPPANHLTHVASLDRRYLVDVGLAVPTIRVPLPLDGTARTDEAGIEWRVVESSRPDSDYTAQFRQSGDEWTDRYHFDTEPREMAYFEATCDYFCTAPESPFTGDPIVTIATERGHTKLVGTTLSTIVAGDERRRTIDRASWDDTLRREFGVRYAPGGRDGGAAGTTQ